MRRLWLLSLLLALSALAAAGAPDPPGGRIVYVRREGERFTLRVMNVDGTGDRELPGQTASVNLFPTVSPDRKRIAFMTGDDPVRLPFQVRILNVDGTGPRTLDGPSSMNGRPAWSPDGTRIVFSSGTGPPGIYLWDLESGGTRPVTMPGEGGASPFWRPDGTIGYSRLKADQSADLASIRADGTGAETLVAGDRLLLAGANAVSPNGKYLAYFAVDLQGNRMSLRIWDFAQKSETTLSDGGGLGLTGFPTLPAAAWAPDGETLLASLPTAKGLGLFRVSRDGKTRSRLTAEGMDCIHPAWLGPA